MDHRRIEEAVAGADLQVRTQLIRPEPAESTGTPVTRTRMSIWSSTKISAGTPTNANARLGSMVVTGASYCPAVAGRMRMRGSNAILSRSKPASTLPRFQRPGIFNVSRATDQPPCAACSPGKRRLDFTGGGGTMAGGQSMLKTTHLALAVLLPLTAQPQDRKKGGQRPAGTSPVTPLDIGDRTGFESIFDGTLNGWDGDPAHWRVENGAIVGESTKERPLQRNTFLIWRGGEPKDFELKLDFKINSTNSGVQYRSQEATDVGKWVLKGYQADIDFTNIHTGQIYEERGRGFLALRGQAALVEEDKKSRVIANLKDNADLKGAVRINDWNTLHIIARGNVLIQVLNGQLTAVAVDDDTKGRALQGLIGFQLHVGPPMRAEFRNIYLKKL
ncbi:MAG: DUF1080 domain-containing protein [Acidobacteria bacterium]|nr:DUF1080 domain-containing protein [Acidobacteriota bacterium]